MNKKKTPIRCPQCGQEIELSDEFCECGKLVVFMPSYGEDYNAYAEFQDEEDA